MSQEYIGIQAWLQGLWGLSFSFLPVFLIQVPSILRMFRDTTQHTLVMVSYISKNNVRRATFQDLQDPSTAASVIAVLHALTIINNCIGEKNLRYFLAFLLWHFFLCLYGVVILGAILAGELKERKVFRILTVYYGIENSFSKLTPHIVQWFLNFYNTQVLLILFMAVTSLLLAGFFGYHVHLVITNTTTNETFKWESYKKWQISLTQVKAATESLKHSAELVKAGKQMNPDANTHDSKYHLLNCYLNFKGLFSRWKKEKQSFVQNNVYDRGVIHNISEAIYPLSCRKYFSLTKSD